MQNNKEDTSNNPFTHWKYTSHCSFNDQSCYARGQSNFTPYYTVSLWHTVRDWLTRCHVTFRDAVRVFCKWVSEWVQSRACACLSVHTCERYEVLHLWKCDFMKISASAYNGNTLTLVVNKSFHIRVVWSSDSQLEGRGPLRACETVYLPIVSYKAKTLF